MADLAIHDLAIQRPAMRQFPFKALMFLLMAAVLTAPLAAQGWPTPGNSPGQPAGCHEDAPLVPAPAPSSHECCQSGHEAMLLPSSAPRLELQVSGLIQSPRRAVALTEFNRLPSLAIITGEPPALFPLRV